MDFVLKLIYKNKLFIKYCIVGGTAAVVDFGILAILKEVFNVHYLVAATLSFILAALTNYSLNRRWTFRSDGQKRRQIPIFFTVATLGLLLNNGMMYIGVEFLALWYIWAKVIATGVVLMWNFLGNKYFTFAVKKEIII